MPGAAQQGLMLLLMSQPHKSKRGELHLGTVTGRQRKLPEVLHDVAAHKPGQHCAVLQEHCTC